MLRRGAAIVRGKEMETTLCVHGDIPEEASVAVDRAEIFPVADELSARDGGSGTTALATVLLPFGVGVMDEMLLPCKGEKPFVGFIPFEVERDHSVEVGRKYIYICSRVK